MDYSTGCFRWRLNKNSQARALKYITYADIRNGVLGLAPGHFQCMSRATTDNDNQHTATMLHMYCVTSCRYMFWRPRTHHHGTLASLLVGVQRSMLPPPAVVANVIIKCSARTEDPWKQGFHTHTHTHTPPWRGEKLSGTVEVRKFAVEVKKSCGGTPWRKTRSIMVG